MPPKPIENAIFTVPALQGRPAWKVNPVQYVESLTENINQDMAQHSAKVAWVGQNWADAKYEREQLKAKRDKVEAELVVKAFEAAFNRDKGGKPTGKEIDAVVQQMTPYIDANDEYLEMCRVVDNLDSLRTALDHRIQALIGLGAMLRREYDSRDPGRVVERIRDREGRDTREREEEYRERLRREREEHPPTERRRR